VTFTAVEGKVELAKVKFEGENLERVLAEAGQSLARTLLSSEAVLAYSIRRRRALDAARTAPSRAGGRIAVLDVRSYVPGSDVVYLSDRIRSLAFDALPDAQVITRENIMVLLAASGRKIEDCDAECEVETGRRLGAEMIISGDLHLIGKSYRLNLRIHATKTASLVGVAMAQGGEMESLDANLPAAMRELLKPLK